MVKLIMNGSMLSPITSPRHLAAVVSAMMTDCSTCAPVYPRAWITTPQSSVPRLLDMLIHAYPQLYRTRAIASAHMRPARSANLAIAGFDTAQTSCR